MTCVTDLNCIPNALPENSSSRVSLDGQPRRLSPHAISLQACSERKGQRAAQEFCEWRHLLAGRRERAHEFRVAHLRFSESDGCAKIAQFQVFDEFVIHGEAAWRARKFR